MPQHQPIGLVLGHLLVKFQILALQDPGLRMGGTPDANRNPRNVR